MTTLQLAHVVDRTIAEGPGARLALWVQGCRIRCPGCCNPHLFDAGGGRSVTVESLVERLAGVRDEIEGVTLLGGEPFEQAAPLAAFAEGARRLGLGVMTFTGHVVEDLRASGVPEHAALLAATDLLVDGPYDARRPETARRWAGSTNQRFHFMTTRYAPGIELVREGEAERTVELRIEASGVVRANGWPDLRRILRG